MKKILFYIICILFFSATTVFGAVVTQRKIQPQNPSTQTKNIKTNKLENSIIQCTPYTETMDADYMGVKMSYKIQIRGWINDKCVLEFNADTKGLNSAFGDLFDNNSDILNISVYSFTPKVKCEFTKEQLDYVGDSILEENSRQNGGKMLKDPNSINLGDMNNLSLSDAKLLDVIFNHRACTVNILEAL